MDGRGYSVECHAVAITAQQDFVYLKPAADKPIAIEAAFASISGGTADAGDAQEELLELALIRLPATVTAGSGGGSFTPTPLYPNDAAAGVTARINDTTKATTSGTAQQIHSAAMNSRQEYQYIPLPEHRPVIVNATAVVFRLNTTPADSVLFNVSVYLRELV